MIKTKTLDRVEKVLEVLPKRVRFEIERVLSSRRYGGESVKEIRIRARGISTVLCGFEVIPLYEAIDSFEMNEIVRRLCDGAVYAHRDSIASGYISMGQGIRVGVCGSAKYDKKSVVGVTDITSLVFRIPGHECAFSSELYKIFLDGVGCGMLIYSPPGVGKTTALRSLASSIGAGRGALRVAVVDERCEFMAEDYENASVDILCGYKRRAGIEIATRTMSPDVMMIDELLGEDASSIMSVVRCGIPLIATAHAKSFDDLLMKSGLSELISRGVFSVFVGISLSGGEYFLTVDRK